MSTLPWTYEPRPDTRTTTVRIGVWLFVASEAMFFGSLFSAYVLLRAGAASWPEASLLGGARELLLPTLMLLLATAALRHRLALSIVCAMIFLVAEGFGFARVLDAGAHPTSNLLIASWFVLTGVHWLHVAGGVAANAWVMQSKATLVPQHYAERLHALWVYWCFIDLVWAAILVSFYFI